MKYRWILFDADGTLFDFASAESSALRRSFDQAELPYEERFLDLYREINQQIWLQLEQGTIRRSELKIRRFEQFFAAAALIYDPADFSDRYLENLAQGADLLAGAETLVRNLSGRVDLVLITNGLTKVQRPRIAASSIRDHFSHVVISEEVGFAKPDRRIFDIAFKRMGHPDKGDVLIVGDSLSSDIRGGIDYGIDTCWFNPECKSGAPEATSRYEIRALSEIESLVGIG